MPQGLLPFFPAGVTQISEALAFMKQDGNVVYFNYQMPVFMHAENDDQTFRMITSQFCVNGNAKQAEIVRAFGVPPISVKRAVKKYREGGPALFYSKPKPRGPSKLTPKVLQRMQQMLDGDKSTVEVATTLNLLENTVRKAISDGQVVRSPKKKINRTDNRMSARTSKAR